MRSKLYVQSAQSAAIFLLPMENSDSQLVLACRRGDQLAWEKLIQRYQRLIFAIPRRAGLDEDQAAEVFQEVFATLCQRINDIEEPERLRAWLVTTARRKTWRVIQKAQHWQQSGVDEEEDANDIVITDDAPLPDEQLMILEEQHRIRTALSQLDERCQKLLQMLFYVAAPPPYSEIARILGTSEGSIGPTRARCLEKLMRILEK
jgi:RNA polymerase sigma factor (sigma-70 family)